MNIDIRDFALRGARSRLVELEKEKQAILKRFKELDLEEAASEAAAELEPPLGAGGRRLSKTGLTFKVWAWWVTEKKINSISTRDVVEALGVKSGAASGAINQLVAQKLAKRVGRGVFRLV